MYKIVGGDQKEYGPVTADELRRWIAEGRLNGQSLVRAEGQTDWLPLMSYPEFAEALGPHAAAPGVTLPGEAGAASALSSEEILAREPRVEVGECLSLSWQLLRSNFALLVGV